MCLEGNVSRFQRENTWKSCVQDPSRPCPVCLFTWLVLICILYNKNVTVSTMLSCFLWVVLVNYQTWGSWKILWICSGLGTPKFAADIWSEGSLVRNSALNLGNLLGVVSITTVLHCSTMVTPGSPCLFSMNTKCQAWCQGTWVQSQTCHLIALWSWASHITVLSVSVPISEWEGLDSVASAIFQLSTAPQSGETNDHFFLWMIFIYILLLLATAYGWL